jgi:hypothetical protein
MEHRLKQHVLWSFSASLVKCNPLSQQLCLRLILGRGLEPDGVTDKEEVAQPFGDEAFDAAAAAADADTHTGGETEMSPMTNLPRAGTDMVMAYTILLERALRVPP